MTKLLFALATAVLALAGCATDNSAISQATGGPTGAEGTASGTSGSGTGTQTTEGSIYGLPGTGAY